MTRRTQILGVLFVGTIMLQNYESQISRVDYAQIAAWHAHDWVGASVRILIAGAIAAKAFLTDSSTAPEKKEGAS